MDKHFFFYKDCTSCVINSGYAAPFFNIRGVRQGCPLSLYLFIICIELLAVRNDPNLEGISILNCDAEKEIKISLYADDTTLLLPGREETLPSSDRHFQQISNILLFNSKSLEMRSFEDRIFTKFKCSLKPGFHIIAPVATVANKITQRQ